jgi:hypothetical protein
LSIVERCDEDHGASDLGKRVIAIIGLCCFDGLAGGDSAEGLRDFNRNVVDLVEGKDPIVQGEMEKLAIADREAPEWSKGGINKGPDGAGESGFAAGGGASKNEDGVGSGGAEGGCQPGENPRFGIGREMEKFRECL